MLPGPPVSLQWCRFACSWGAGILRNSCAVNETRISTGARFIVDSPIEARFTTYPRSFATTEGVQGAVSTHGTEWTRGFVRAV